MRPLLLILSFLMVSCAFAENELLKQQLNLLMNSKASFEKRIQEIDEILALALKTKDAEFQADLYRLKGGLQCDQGDLKNGLDNIIMSLSLCRHKPLSASYIASLQTISTVYYGMGEIEKAKSYCKEALNLVLSNGEGNQGGYLAVVNSSHNLSQMYYEQDSLIIAEEYINIYENALRKTGDTSEICDFYVMKGAILQKQQKFAEAEANFRRSFLCASFSGVSTQLYSALINLGELFLELNQNDSAEYYFSQALNLAYKFEYPQLIQESAAGLSAAYEAMGDSAKAFQFLKISKLFSDSLLDQAKIHALIDAEQKYENKTKSILLEQQNEALENRRRQLVFLISIAIVLIVMVILAIINRNKSKQLARQELKIKEAHITELLQEQEVRNVDAMLMGQDSERQRIARELHDRMGSMLSAIKLHFSAVEEQLNKIPETDQKPHQRAMKMLDEAVDEVRKISHDLYSASLVKFGMKAALIQLIESIEASNKIHISFLDNGVSASDYHSFEVELYRITQELIGNTLKYANASEVVIQLNKSDSYLIYSYEDNGVGFNANALKESDGIGYLSIENRVKKINGIGNLDTHPGHGMTYIIEIPL